MGVNKHREYHYFEETKVDLVFGDNFVAAKSASLQVVEYATKLGCLSFKIELTNLSLSIKVYFVGYLHIIIKDKR